MADMIDPVSIVAATTEAHYRQARRLIETYAALRNFDAALAGIGKELERLPDHYVLLLLAYRHDQPAGCVAIQQLEESICEMKRLFVDPAFRGYGIGRRLVAAIIDGARARGFQYMRLDSHPSMTVAQKLYGEFGFREIGRYNQNPIPGIRFFELQLVLYTQPFSP